METNQNQPQTDIHGFTEEQIKEMAVAKLNEDIHKLNKELQELDANVDYTGSKAEIRDQMAKKVRATYDLQREIYSLQKLRNKIEGPSKAVLDYINRKPPTSKFDVDAGRIKLDEGEPEKNKLKGRSLF